MAEVKVRITGDNTGLNAALTRSRVAATAFANRMRSITGGIASRFAGIFAAASIGAAIKRTIEFADQLNDTSQRLGVNVEELQKWEYAAKQTGSSLETLTSVVEKLNKAQSQAAAGDKTAAANLARFGIAKGESIEAMMGKLSAAAQAGRIQPNMAAFQGIAGRGSGELIPALMALKELGDEAERTGLIIRQEQINALEKINDQFTFMGRFIMATLAPAIQFAAEKMIQFAGVIRGIAAFAGNVSANPDKFFKTIFPTSKAELAGDLLIDGLRKAMGKGPRKGSSAAFAQDETGAAAAFFGELEKAKKQIEALRAGGPPIPKPVESGPKLNGKPTKADVDSLAKVGLFTASGLNSQPVLDIQRRILTATEKVARNTEPTDTPDPFP